MQHISGTQELTEWIFNGGKWGKSSQEHLPFEPAPVLKMFGSPVRTNGTGGGTGNFCYKMKPFYLNVHYGALASLSSLSPPVVDT